MKRVFSIFILILFAMTIAANAKLWTKKELLNAGFKFGYQIPYSEVVYGEKINGNLNGIVWLKNSTQIIIGYMVNGEFAAPYIEIPKSDTYNYTGIQENNVSYASYNGYVMSYIVDEIYGFDTSSEAVRKRIKNGSFNIKRVVDSFDDFMSSAQKIPQNAWVDYTEYISGIKIANSYPEERIPNFNNNVSYPEIISCDGICRSSDYKNGEGGMYIRWPKNCDLKNFTIDMDFKPTGINKTGILFSLSRRLEVFIKDGKIEIQGKWYHKILWNTGCPISMGDWNHISIICNLNILVIRVNNCSKIAAFEIPGADLSSSQFLTSYNHSLGDNFKGHFKNIRITYE